MTKKELGHTVLGGIALAIVAGLIVIIGDLGETGAAVVFWGGCVLAGVISGEMGRRSSKLRARQPTPY